MQIVAASPGSRTETQKQAARRFTPHAVFVVGAARKKLANIRVNMSLVAATKAKEEGSVLRPDLTSATASLRRPSSHISRGIQLLFGSGSVPIVDFGLGERSSPLPVHSSIPEAANRTP